jgi:diacylglycerol kinase family enzyme
MALIRAIFAVARGDISKQSDFYVSQRKQLEIYSSQAKIPVSFDGEVVQLAPPLVYRVEPKCLKVLVIPAEKA